MKQWKCLLIRTVVVMLVGIVALLVPKTHAMAESMLTKGGIESNNIHKHEYTWYYQTASKSYLYVRDGVYTRVEDIGEKVIVERYSESFQYQGGMEIAYELPIFGAFYNGAKYNFLVFGQENSEESDEAEVLRIVKYDKDWNRLGALSFYGCNTYVPFEAGNVSFAEYDDFLFIRTCHTMYAKDDGLHHQACMTFSLKQSDMSKVDEFWSVYNIGCGYASHSFNQYIRVANNKIVALDHGDAYPRSIVVGYYNKPVSEGKISYSYSHADMLSIPGTIGANYTGVNVGGFEISSTHYLAAVNTVDFEQYDTSRVKNLKLLTMPVTTMDASEVIVKNITEYPEDGDLSVSNPYLVDMGNDTFSLIWEETKRSNYQYGTPTYHNRVKVAMVDAAGNIIGEVKELEGNLSDCQPIYKDGMLLWYVTDNSAPKFYVVFINEKSEISDKKLKFTGAALTLENNLTVRFLVNPSKLTDCSVTFPYAVFELGGEKTVVKDFTYTDDGKLCFYLHNISPQQMNDTISATLCGIKNGCTVKGGTVNYSVADYCYNLLGNMTDENHGELGRLLVDLLIYGECAQNYTSYRTDALVTQRLDAAKRAWATQETPNCNSAYMNTADYSSGTTYKANWKGAGLYLQEGVNVRYRFEAEDYTGLHIDVWSYEGGSWSYDMDSPQVRKAEEGGYYLYFDELNVSQMRDVLVVQIYDKSWRTISSSVYYSVETYVSNFMGDGSTDLQKLLIAMMKYGDSAEAYATNQSVQE